MPADPVIDLPDGMADDDLSLHAGMTLALQNNQARAYEQSGYDFFALRGNTPYARTIISQEEDTWVWLDQLHLGTPTDQLATLPLPCSYSRTGVWNPIKISFVSTRTGSGAMYSRAYLLSSSGRPALLPSLTDGGVPGDQAYDQKSVSLGSLQSLVFDAIYPRIADSRRGGSGYSPSKSSFVTVPGLSIPMVWLRVALWAESAQSVSLRALRVQELVE
jgi:hypothetical protein